MFERPRRGERAILVHITITSFKEQATLEEFAELAKSAGVVTVMQVTGTRKVPDSGYFIGTGKLEELKALVIAHQVEVVLFNHTLTPSQERNLEQALECRVLGRTGVILDIFAQRARSAEGKLQVELAQLQYLSTRLIRGWTHLERQRGGIGLRGPGETQLETDRRLLSERIKYLQKRLEKVSQQREISRKARQRAELSVVSLVGYTNAGKSTLFNSLTHSSVYTADQLFATLDATLRRVTLVDKTSFILADTVGFIQQLPHDLVAAFRATLEETRQASLLLHVVDATDPERDLRIEQVNQVLTEIDAGSIPQILVYNKIDQLTDYSARLERPPEFHKTTKIWLSALRHEGLELLKTAIAEYLSTDLVQRWVRLPTPAGQLRARLYSLGTVLQERYEEHDMTVLEVQISERTLTQLLHSTAELKVVEGNGYSQNQLN